MLTPRDVTVVVAKKEENACWIKALPRHWRVIVVSKAENEENNSFVRLANKGGYAHTYLYYISKRYNSLSQITVFCKENPFLHSPNFIDKINNMKNFGGFLELSDTTLIFDYLARPHLAKETKTPKGLTFSNFYEFVLGAPCPKLLCCRANSTFAVSRQVVRKRGRAFYKRALATLEYSEELRGNGFSDESPVEGIFFERMWHKVFSPSNNLSGDSGASSQLQLRGMTFSALEKLYERLEGSEEAAGYLQSLNKALAASEEFQH